MKILIIEDQTDVRDTLKDLLEINGHEVLCAVDGREGVQRAAEHPDFIFCDLAMPHLDGHGVLAAVKKMPVVCDVPFVFLTARAERAELREGMALGAYDYITKPFTERDILDSIAARTRRHRGIRSQVEQWVERHRREIHASWSHELLTPLNAVMGSLDLLDLQTETIDRGELKEILGIIREGAERQERLARKLIGYFSLEQRLSRSPDQQGRCYAEQAIAAGVHRACRKLNSDEQIRLSTEPGEIGIDEEALAFAVAEVITNALEFSAAQEPVMVNGAIREGRYRIEIADRGPGLTAEQRASFGAFTQFGRNRREQQGLGLGLAIARATARLAGGTLLLDPGPGAVGLRVVFDLPLAGRGE